MSGLSVEDVERHACCLKRHLCRDEHFHQRDVEAIVARHVEAFRLSAVAAIEAEHLTDDTGRSEDIAYDIGIDHAAKAVRNLSPDT